ncbi:cytochrome P450 [Aspergillus caelatus]|uniref:Cytochrome P450 n=1 Tax=Aspergillus caelatus TaxID=61420 RepID=A0A5N6ZUK1_9EURO|nr:cytochrome P450 [Aspergillus caelatus]KAE8359940.1 cytochrome P450 [Aspergillus caelatus]
MDVMRNTQIMPLGFSMVRRYEFWATLVLLLLLCGLSVLFSQFIRQAHFPDGAPRPLGEGYPILGALRFFSDRYNMYFDGISLSRTGSFSFYFGKHQIVGISGLEGRKVFFQDKAMDLSQGYTLLLATTPSFRASPRPPDESLHSSKWFRHTLAGMMSKDNLVANLLPMIKDTDTTFKDVTDPITDTGIVNIFEETSHIVYQSTMRVIGFNKIADSDELCSTTLKLFQCIENGTSPSRIIFPWLPTPAFLRRLTAGIRLYRIFKRLIQVDEDTDQRIDDTSQSLARSGSPIEEIIGFVLGTLFASQVNTPICAAWLLVYLATNPHWLNLVRAEIDSVLKKHGDLDETPHETFGRLHIDVWESEFPLIELCLRECIRLHLAGSAFRRNISGQTVPIGSTGEVIPKDAYLFYLVDEVHFNPDIYPNPNLWDPGRYLPGAPRSNNIPLSYLGWGAGRHPCVGMRLAKLNVTVIITSFVSMFRFTLCNDRGEPVTEPPIPDRNLHSPRKPSVPLKLKVKRM